MIEVYKNILTVNARKVKKGKILTPRLTSPDLSRAISITSMSVDVVGEDVRMKGERTSAG